ncbi:exocyst complex component EXO70B1-like [Abrus precatorius]|uniref:Exocyst subunit Exo70 family protein n=1 Tax=Abrus precatorius TaxID=3816 RepID=A0A8B8KPN8_ABRPR|nr:exocyst complex component EXO70B1-like [Abrus precatorius]
MENLALDIIFRWDSDEFRRKMIFSGDQQEAECYLQAVDEIQLSNDESAIPIAMARLEDEFRNILISHTNPTSYLHHLNTKEEIKEEEPQQGCACFGHLRFNASPSARRHVDDHDMLLLPSRFREIPYDATNDLRCIAERMISSGYLDHCIHVYASVRKSGIFAYYKWLGINDVQLPLAAKIHLWIEASKVCVRTMFAGEKRFCEEIFDGVGDDIDHACFMETVKEPAIQFLNFADAICITARSLPDEMFKILELYEAFAAMIPDFDDVFDFKSCECLRVKAVEVLSRLAEGVNGTLSKFEKAVAGDTSKVVVPGGAIHPLTLYVMNYLKLICVYEETLNELIVLKPSMDLADITEEEGKTPLAIHLIWIIEKLQIKLNGESKQYKDSSLSHLFMMNNLHFILNVVKSCSELMHMIGDDYLKKLTMKFQRATTSYQGETWGRVLDCLKDEGLDGTAKHGFLYVIFNSPMKQKMKAFNAMFEKVHRTQAARLIPDSQLREEIRKSILEKLLPAYNAFLRRNLSSVQNGTHVVNYLKYSKLDLQVAVLDFFEGIHVSQHLRKRSQSHA